MGSYDVLFLSGVVSVVLSVVTAVDIARDRRRPAWAWGLAGLLAPLVAPVLVWLMPPNPRYYEDCPHCRMLMHKSASVCPHCTRGR